MRIKERVRNINDALIGLPIPDMDATALSNAWHDREREIDNELDKVSVTLADVRRFLKLFCDPQLEDSGRIADIINEIEDYPDDVRLVAAELRGRNDYQEWHWYEFAKEYHEPGSEVYLALEDLQRQVEIIPDFASFDKALSVS